MQEHQNKQQNHKAPARRSGGPTVVDASRLAGTAIQHAQGTLLRAGQELFNLVQSQGPGGQVLAPTPTAFGPSTAVFVQPSPGAGWPQTIQIPGASNGPSWSPAAFGLPSAPQTPWVSGAQLSTGLHSVGFGSPMFTPFQNNARCDIADEGTGLVCKIELPGIQPDDVEVLCFDTCIVITATPQVPTDSVTLIHAERNTHNPVQRTIALPCEIVPSGCEATLRNGILTICVPKANPTEGPRRINVKA